MPREKPDLEVPPNPGYESNDVRARPDAIDAATAAENFASTPDLLAPTKLESRTPAKFWYRVFKPFVGADVSSKLQTEIDKGEDVSITSMNDVFGDPAHGVRKVFSAVCDYVPADPDHVPAGTPPPASPSFPFPNQTRCPSLSSMVSGWSFGLPRTALCKEPRVQSAAGAG